MHTTRIPFILMVALIVLFGTIINTQPAAATPFTWGDKIVKPPAWPKNSTIDVYIQKDPKNQGRDDLIKEGVERWKARMSARMITVNVSIGDPPAGDSDAVSYTWEADGFKSGDDELGSGAGQSDGLGTATTDGTKLDGGSAHIRNALPAGTEKEKEFLRNLGEHEFTHVLGLADDAKGALTKHEQPDTPRNANDQDTKEINTLYGTAATGGNTKPQGAVTPSGGGAGLGFYDYQFDFVPADLTDPQHVSLFTLAIDPSLVTGFDLPPGWIGLNPSGGVSSTDPFFSEGYMLDGFGAPAPWDLLQPTSFLAFRTSATEALLDGLDPLFDPALSPDNPTLSLRLFVNDPVLDGPVQVWAGGELQTVIGPVRPVPAPSSALLLIIGLALLRLLRYRVLSGD